MTPQEIKERYQQIINTLNAVEVHGVTNMNHLLGCILSMEKLWTEIEQHITNISIEEVIADAADQAD